MIIAVTSMGGSLEALVSEQFGRCPYFIFYNTENKKFTAVSNLGDQMNSGAGPKAAQVVIDNDASVLLTGFVGDKAAAVFERTGIKIITGYKKEQKVIDIISDYTKTN